MGHQWWNLILQGLSPVIGRFGSKTTRCAWPQEAKSEILEVSVAYSSFVVSHQDVILYCINMHKLFVIAHRCIKHVRKCTHSIAFLVHSPKSDLCEWRQWHQSCVESVIFDPCDIVPMLLPAIPEVWVFPQMKVECFERLISLYKFNSVTRTVKQWHLNHWVEVTVNWNIFMHCIKILMT
jgi:hypothetical protein